MSLNQPLDVLRVRRRLKEVKGIVCALWPGAHLQVRVETYAPGADTGPADQHDAGEAGAVVVSGRLRATAGVSERILEAGDAFLFQDNQPHRFRSDSDVDCVIVRALSPPPR